VTISEVYPPQLPDLFHGSQLVVLGRYTGQGHAVVKLSGAVGQDSKEFVYEVDFKSHTNRDKGFVEDLWARRKVGYLLDQIRVNGENKEVKDEVVALAKKYGITTPYTSYLVVPDVAAPVAQVPALMPPDAVFGKVVKPQMQWAVPNATMVPPGSNRIQYAPVVAGPQMQWAVPNGTLPSGLTTTTTGGPVIPQMGWNAPSAALPTSSLALNTAAPANTRIIRPDPLGGNRGTVKIGNGATAGEEEEEEEEEEDEVTSPKTYRGTKARAGKAPNALNTHSGKAGVDLSLQLDQLRNQNQVTQATVRIAAGRKCLDLNGIWTDEGFDAKLPVVKIKAQGDAYFRILKRHQTVAEVFQLGNRVVWVMPSQTVLVIDPAEGREQMTDEEIDRLFVPRTR
jgi:Ca-activated chloride channel homolog